jgi:hypothetical protein
MRARCFGREREGAAASASTCAASQGVDSVDVTAAADVIARARCGGVRIVILEGL